MVEKCFQDSLRINGTTEDAEQLAFLRPIIGFNYLIRLESSATFADALRT